MRHVVRVGMIQPLASLASDVLQIPDREAFSSRQHGGNAVSLHVLHGSTELAIDFFGAEKLSNIVAA